MFEIQYATNAIEFTVVFFVAPAKLVPMTDMTEEKASAAGPGRWSGSLNMVRSFTYLW